MRIEFDVPGRPPRGHGPYSQWGKAGASNQSTADPSDAPLVAILRQQSLAASNQVGVSQCLHGRVSVQLTIYLPEKDLTGSPKNAKNDLDWFISGVFDSLQAAEHIQQKDLHSIFSDPIHSNIGPLLIENDCFVMSVKAEKRAVPDGQGPYYHVVVETLENNAG